ncbi:MAG: AsmA family protein [Pseudomonadota bacterium]
MKAVKLISKVILGLLVVLVLAVIALVVLIDPNDFKPQIEQAVYDNTGRELTIDGDISWSFIPRFGFNVGHTEIANAEGYQARVFAEIDEFDVGIQIPPLLTGSVEVDVVYLDGLVANLEVKSDGRSNWDDFVEADGTPDSVKSGPRAATVEPESGESGLASLPPISLGGVHISNAQVNYSDLSGGMAAMLEDFEFKTGPIVLWEPIDFEGSFRVENQYPELQADFSYSGTVVAKVLEDQFALNNFKLAMDARGEPIPNGAIKLSVAADVAANTALEKAELQQLKIRFDDTTIDGQAMVEGFSEPAIDFKVAIDQLDADRYLPEPAEAPEPTAWEEEPPQDVDTDPKIELPLVLLRGLDVDGEFTMGQFQIMGLTTSDIKAVLSAHNGVIDLKPLAVSLYDGQFDGAVQIDATDRLPRYAVTADLAGVQVQPLLTDFADFDLVAGNGNFDLDIHTTGERVSELKRGLNGNLSLAFADGSIQGNIRGQLDKWAELIGKKDELYAESGETTTFKTLDASATIVDGKLVTNDLDMESGDLRVTGDGSFDIPTEYLDFVYTLHADGQSCPIGIQGKLMEIDYARAAKNAVPDCVKALLNQRLDAEKEKLKRELEAKKDEAKAKLEAEEKRLREEAKRKEAEARAELERKKQEEKEKLEDKAKDELKKLLDF